MKGIGLKILMSFCTEKFIKKILVIGLKKLVKSTKNTLDDELIKPVVEVLEG